MSRGTKHNAFNRRRAYAFSNANAQRWANPKAVPSPTVGKTLHVKSLVNGQTLSAFYVRKLDGTWKVQSCDKELDFLRCCGKPDDARRALVKRKLSWSWR